MQAAGETLLALDRTHLEIEERKQAEFYLAKRQSLAEIGCNGDGCH